MKFNILDLTATDLAREKIRKNTKLPPFRYCVHHITEIFMNHLPKIEINNNSKITILFGEQGDSPLFENVLGVSNIFIEDFNFDNFYKLSKTEQNLTIVKTIEKTLINFCIKGKNIESIPIIEETIQKVIDSKFNQKIEIKKLSKSSKNRKIRFKIYRVLNADVGESWLCEIHNKHNNQIETKWMTSTPDYLDRRDYFKKSHVDNEKYYITNNFSKIVFEQEVNI